MEVGAGEYTDAPYRDEGPVIELSDLAYLAGAWAGNGHAQYPTIPEADYREELVFSSDGKNPFIHYVQRTWRIGVGSEEPLFWESGFLIDRGNGTFEMASSQQSGRMEILRGNALAGPKREVALELNSVSIVNDDRMIRSQRIYHFRPGSLSYELRMSTKVNPTMDVHLRATLSKNNPT